MKNLDSFSALAWFAPKFWAYRLVWVFFGPGLALAQGPLDGYLKGRGVLDIAPSFSFNRASVFAGAGGAQFAEGYRGQMLSLFAEYGLTRELDVVGTAAAVFTSTQSGLQDGGVFLKYRPYYRQLGQAGKVGVLLGAGATFPIANYAPTATGALGQKATTLPLRAIVQWETPLGLFLNLTGGYHWRLDNLHPEDIALLQQQRPDYTPGKPRDFSTFLLKLGFPARHFYLDAWAEWQHTVGGADYAPGVPDLPQAYGVSYFQVGGTAYYSDNGRSGGFISWGKILSGRNTSLINRLTFGLVLKPFR